MIAYGKEKMRLPKKLMNEVIIKHFVWGKFLLTYWLQNLWILEAVI